MRELVIISGKGGTGKTSLSAAFSDLAGSQVLADCDVDASDLPLILSPIVQTINEFRCGNEAIVKQSSCSSCGKCIQLCRFNAIRRNQSGKAYIDPSACEGCGVCVHFCPQKAIDFPERLCGEYFVSLTRNGTMVHARMKPGSENSGKLVSEVRKEARRLALEQQKDFILTDGPPGIACPVIASITGADAILAVTEPSLSGAHDLERILSLAAHFKIKALVCVNKWDINPENTLAIESAALKAGAFPVGRIPYDKLFTRAQIAGRTVVKYHESSAAEAVKEIWDKTSQFLSQLK